MTRTTWAPVGAADHGAATGNDDAFDDRYPTQPIAVGRQVGLGLDGRHTGAPAVAGRRVTAPVHRERPPSWHHAAAPAGSASHGEPARRADRPARLTILIVVAVLVAAVTGALGYRTWASSSPSAASDAPAQADDVPGRPPPPGSDLRHRGRPGALGAADGAVPDGTTVFDDEIPGVAHLDPGLLTALRQAAADAADDRVAFVVNSGWRSPEYQEHLLDEAVSTYGSKKEAARWVATADTSPHVSGDAVDIGPAEATAWLSEHGAEYGLCQIYRNEPWHYELRPDAVDDGCPPLYADPTHDPRMQR